VEATIYERAGGLPAFVALARAHHARCLADPELNHPFSKDDLNPEHVDRLAAYWSEVLGGPPVFSGGLSDQAALLRIHAGHGDMAELGRRFVACFVSAADDAHLPEDPELRAALRNYMEWAVADVLDHERPESIPSTVPMPRWTWDGLSSDR
jgi:hemoglobin